MFVITLCKRINLATASSMRAFAQRTHRDVKFKVEQYMQTRNISKDLQLKVIKSMIVRNQEE